jgi:hypothetical protein
LALTSLGQNNRDSREDAAWHIDSKITQIVVAFQDINNNSNDKSIYAILWQDNNNLPEMNFFVKLIGGAL